MQEFRATKSLVRPCMILTLLFMGPETWAQACIQKIMQSNYKSTMSVARKLRDQIGFFLKECIIWRINSIMKQVSNF